MATTTNFGWTTPDDTDLVKDGAAAIRTLGSSIDTSLVDLNGGTTGQVLTKASDTDLDFSFTTPASIPITTEGDLVIGDASGDAVRLAIGSAGTVLTSDGDTADWAAPASTSGPAISVYRTTNQTVSANTYTKVEFTSEEFDTDSCYDTSTHRFTPNVAGKYLIQHCIIRTGSQNYAILYKNGTRIKGVGQSGSIGATANGSTIGDMDGSTDYIEFYAYLTSGTTIEGTAEYSFASAAFQRS